MAGRAARPRRQSISRRDEPGRIAAADTAGEPAVHPGCLHGVRDARARQRRIPDPFLPEETRAGATELVNATRGGSEGSDVEVYDPRTGKPLKFTYQRRRSETHAIHAQLPLPVPAGGIGRVLIYKTYKDPRTYTVHGDDIVWVRSLSGYRLGVLLPKGFAFISSNVAAQLTHDALTAG